MYKKSFLLLTLCFVSSLLAGDLKQEQAKYQKMKKASLEKHRKQNPELTQLRTKIKELSQEMMQLAISISPEIANAEADQRWTILVEKMDEITAKSSDFKSVYEARKKAYEEISEILHLLDPKLKEQGKRTWEAKQESSNI